MIKLIDLIPGAVVRWESSGKIKEGEVIALIPANMDAFRIMNRKLIDRYPEGVPKSKRQFDARITGQSRAIIAVTQTNGSVRYYSPRQSTLTLSGELLRAVQSDVS